VDAVQVSVVCTPVVPDATGVPGAVGAAVSETACVTVAVSVADQFPTAEFSARVATSDPAEFAASCTGVIDVLTQYDAELPAARYPVRVVPAAQVPLVVDAVPGTGRAQLDAKSTGHVVTRAWASGFAAGALSVSVYGAGIVPVFVTVTGAVAVVTVGLY